MRHYLLEKDQVTTHVIQAKPLFFPVKFQLPDDVKEHFPAAETRKIEGQLTMRFYCQPIAGDTIEHGGLTWQVSHLAHRPQRKGSPKSDECPIVITEFIGVIQP
jgi:hypothetical protein